MSSREKYREKRRVRTLEAAERAGIKTLRVGNAWHLTGRGVSIVVCDLSHVDPARDFVPAHRHSIDQ